MKNSNIHKNYYIYIQSVPQHDVHIEIVYSWYHSKSKNLNRVLQYYELIYKIITFWEFNQSWCTNMHSILLLS